MCLLLCLLGGRCTVHSAPSVAHAIVADPCSPHHPSAAPRFTCRGVVRQLGKPNLLAATYSSNAAAAATAAMEELEETLLGSLQELQRIGSGVGELGGA